MGNLRAVLLDLEIAVTIRHLTRNSLREQTQNLFHFGFFHIHVPYYRQEWQ